MKIFRQIIIIFGISIVSEIINLFLPVSVPGSLIAMLAIFILLTVGWLKEDNIKETADFLMKSMSVIFVPMGVGVLRELISMQDKLAAIVITILSAVVITFLSGYAAANLVKRIQDKMSGA